MTKQKETHFSTSFAWRISSKGHNHIESFYSVPYTDTCSQRHHLRGGKCQSFKRAVTLYFFVPVNIVQHMQTMGKKCLCLFSCLRSEFEGETEVFVSGQGVVLHIFIRFDYSSWKHSIRGLQSFKASSATGSPQNTHLWLQLKVNPESPWKSLELF